jgi:hypothetical protein
MEVNQKTAEAVAERLIMLEDETLKLRVENAELTKDLCDAQTQIADQYQQMSTLCTENAELRQQLVAAEEAAEREWMEGLAEYADRLQKLLGSPKGMSLSEMAEHAFDAVTKLVQSQHAVLDKHSLARNIVAAFGINNNIPYTIGGRSYLSAVDAVVELIGLHQSQSVVLDKPDGPDWWHGRDQQGREMMLHLDEYDVEHWDDNHREWRNKALWQRVPKAVWPKTTAAAGTQDGLVLRPSQSQARQPPPDVPETNCGNMPTYPLRPGATALLVPLDLQPPPGVEIEMSPDGLCAWWNNNGIDYGSQMPVRPGDLIATTQGPRRVNEVRAVEVASISCESWKFGHTLAYDLHDEWSREHPGCDWAWFVSVATEVKSDA